MRTLLMFIHILAAGTWFGTNMVQLATNPKVRTYPKVVGAWWVRRTVAFGTRIYMPASIVLLLTGIFLVIDSGSYEFSDGFVTIGFLMVIAGAALGVLIFGPRGEALASAIEDEDEAEMKRLSVNLASFGLFDTVLLIVTIYAMVDKWGL